MNGRWIEGAFEPATTVNLAVAVSRRDGGPVAPTIPGADRLQDPHALAGTPP